MTENENHVATAIGKYHGGRKPDPPRSDGLSNPVVVVSFDTTGLSTFHSNVRLVHPTKFDSVVSLDAMVGRYFPLDVGEYMVVGLFPGIRYAERNEIMTRCFIMDSDFRGGVFATKYT